MPNIENKVLGTFTGKCCDYTAVNNNGMYLSQELFENLLDSEDYKRAIENGYYIGFLGHPDDVDDMNFKNACVVMRDMRIEDNGDVTGVFDLIDTPVGRIVKAFTDAGVKFGISIRGAGDVGVDGTVDPNTFVFRGFDLVTFPAYNDCVPEFQAIAASTNADAQSKYKKVCAAVKTNLKDVTSCEAIEVIQDQFNDHSDEYAMLADRAEQLQACPQCKKENLCEDEECSTDLKIGVLEQKVQALTSLYVEKVAECNQLKEHVAKLMTDLHNSQERQARIQQVVNCQAANASTRMSALKKQNAALKKQAVEASSKLYAANSAVKKLTVDNNKLVLASNRLKAQSSKDAENAKKAITNANLVSNKKIEANQKLLADKDNSIRALKAKVSKTVAAKTELEKHVSNLEADIDTLTSRVNASEHIIFEYQKAYADNCAYAAGVAVSDIPVTASTTVEQLRKFIYSKAGSDSYVKASDAVCTDGCYNDEDDADITNETGVDNLVSI